MTTGYTDAIVTKDQNFEEFAMMCAKAFGFLHDVDDEAELDTSDTPIVELEDTGEHAKAKANAEAELQKLLAMNHEARIAYGENLRNNRVKGARDNLEARRAEGAKIESMKLRVDAWLPPTPGHEALKKFMARQLVGPALDYFERLLREQENLKPMEVFEDALYKLFSDCQHHSAQQAKCAKRISAHNKWVRELRESLYPSDDDKKMFTVIAVSSNRNSFGLTSVLLLAEDGEGWEILKSLTGASVMPKPGMTLVRKGDKFLCGHYMPPRELPKVKPEEAAKIIAEAKANN